jgi:hypothetical protein
VDRKHTVSFHRKVSPTRLVAPNGSWRSLKKIDSEKDDTSSSSSSASSSLQSSPSSSPSFSYHTSPPKKVSPIKESKWQRISKKTSPRNRDGHIRQLFFVPKKDKNLNHSEENQKNKQKDIVHFTSLQTSKPKKNVPVSHKFYQKIFSQVSFNKNSSDLSLLKQINSIAHVDGEDEKSNKCCSSFCHLGSHEKMAVVLRCHWQSGEIPKGLVTLNVFPIEKSTTSFRTQIMLIRIAPNHIYSNLSSLLSCPLIHKYMWCVTEEDVAKLTCIVGKGRSIKGLVELMTDKDDEYVMISRLYDGFQDPKSKWTTIGVVPWGKENLSQSSVNEALRDHMRWMFLFCQRSNENTSMNKRKTVSLKRIQDHYIADYRSVVDEGVITKNHMGDLEKLNVNVVYTEEIARRLFKPISLPESKK